MREYKYLNKITLSQIRHSSMNASGHSAVSQVRGVCPDRGVSRNLQTIFVCSSMDGSLASQYVSITSGRKDFALGCYPVCMNEWNTDVMFDQINRRSKLYS